MGSKVTKLLLSNINKDLISISLLELMNFPIKHPQEMLLKTNILLCIYLNSLMYVILNIIKYNSLIYFIRNICV